MTNIVSMLSPSGSAPTVGPRAEQAAGQSSFSEFFDAEARPGEEPKAEDVSKASTATEETPADLETAEQNDPVGRSGSVRSAEEKTHDPGSAPEAGGLREGLEFGSRVHKPAFDTPGGAVPTTTVLRESPASAALSLASVRQSAQKGDVVRADTRSVQEIDRASVENHRTAPPAPVPEWRAGGAGDRIDVADAPRSVAHGDRATPIVGLSENATSKGPPSTAEHAVSIRQSAAPTQESKTGPAPGGGPHSVAPTEPGIDSIQPPTLARAGSVPSGVTGLSGDGAESRKLAPADTDAAGLSISRAMEPKAQDRTAPISNSAASADESRVANGDRQPKSELLSEVAKPAPVPDHTRRPQEPAIALKGHTMSHARSEPLSVATLPASEPPKTNRSADVDLVSAVHRGPGAAPLPPLAESAKQPLAEPALQISRLRDPAQPGRERSVGVIGGSISLDRGTTAVPATPTQPVSTDFVVGEDFRELPRFTSTEWQSRGMNKSDIPKETVRSAATPGSQSAHPMAFGPGGALPQSPANMLGKEVISAAGVDSHTGDLELEVALATVGSDAKTSAFSTSSATLSAAQARPDPALIVRQITDGLARVHEGRVDIRLSPEELGHVRMSLSQSDQGLVVVVAAERAETLDLMRRHSDQLARDLIAMGYENPSFDFERHDARHGTRDPDTGAQEAAVADPDPTLTSAPLAGASGLDLRM